MCAQLIIVESFGFLCVYFLCTIISVIFKFPWSIQLELWLDLASSLHNMNKYFPSHISQIKISFLNLHNSWAFITEKLFFKHTMKHNLV